MNFVLTPHQPALQIWLLGPTLQGKKYLKDMLFFQTPTYFVFKIISATRGSF